jgi:DNA-binding NarL/FixJ family response regulator
MSTLRVLVLDAYEPFRRVVRVIVEFRDDLQIVGEASDGLEAVKKAKVLRPDLILLDVDLPTLNGIQAARRLRDLLPEAKLLFLSVESSADVVREAFNAGGTGYIYKVHVGNELLAGIETVLTGKHFVGSGLEAPPHRHEMLIYSEGAVLLESLIRFIGAALRANSAGIVLATKSNRQILADRLKDGGFDVDSAIQQGIFILRDAAETLSTVTVNGVPDRVLFSNGLRGLIESAANAAKSKHPRVAVFGECAGLLYAQGNVDAAISLEKIGNDLSRTSNIDILCAYPSFPGQVEDSGFKRVRAEHSAVSFL